MPPTKSAAPVAEIFPGEAISAETEASLTISFERTLSVKQYEPVKVFGSLRAGASTPPEQIEMLLSTFDKYGVALAEQVIKLADTKALELRGGAEAPVAVAPARRAAAPRQQAPAGEKLVVEGRAFDSYTNKEGAPAFKSVCDACGKPVYFNPSVNRTTGVEYSARQNIDSSLKFQKGIFCQAHRPPRGGAAPARQYAPAPVAEEDDLAF